MTAILKKVAIPGVLAIAVSFVSGPSHAQVYVNQANPGVDSVYVNQVPPGARPQPPATNKPVRRAVAQRSPAAGATVVAGNSGPLSKPRYPDVASGSSGIVRPSVSEWPSVGRGAVNR